MIARWKTHGEPWGSLRPKRRQAPRPAPLPDQTGDAYILPNPQYSQGSLGVSRTKGQHMNASSYVLIIYQSQAFLVPVVDTLRIPTCLKQPCNSLATKTSQAPVKVNDDGRGYHQRSSLDAANTHTCSGRAVVRRGFANGQKAGCVYLLEYMQLFGRVFLANICYIIFTDCTSAVHSLYILWQHT